MRCIHIAVEDIAKKGKCGRLTELCVCWYAHAEEGAACKKQSNKDHLLNHRF